MIPFNKDNKITDKSLSEDIFYYCFPGLSQHSSLCHRIFTRNGGLSSHPYKSLNISYSVGDDPSCVEKNMLAIKRNTGADRLVHMNQQHGKKVISIKEDDAAGPDRTCDADALITDIPSVAIMVKQADCQGIILFDPVKSVAAVVHSGWKGSVKNIIGETVKRMETDFSSNPENISAAIGPSLGPCCAEFRTYKEILPERFQDFMADTFHFDFWAISEMQLADAGLKKNNIEKAGICTKCNRDVFYSYRGEGATGRFATVALIKGSQ